MKSRYSSDALYKTQERGGHFEKAVCAHYGWTFLHGRMAQITLGDTAEGVEIKLDDGCLRYGHLSIEIAEKSHASDPEWRGGGIFSINKAPHYLQGTYEKRWFFERADLLEFFRSEQPLVTEHVGTIRRFFLEYPDANRMATWVDDALLTREEGLTGAFVLCCRGGKNDCVSLCKVCFEADFHLPLDAQEQTRLWWARQMEDTYGA